MDRYALSQHAVPNGIALILVGCVVMAMAGLVALAGTGAGHGWMIPIAITIFLFPVWPVAAWLPSRRRVRPRLEIALALLLALLSVLPAYKVLFDEFGAWERGNYVEVAPPWFGIAVVVFGTMAALAWLWREGRMGALLPAWLLGIGMLLNLGIVWHANYGPGPWGFRGSEPDVIWFFLWGAWHLPAVWALLRAFDPVEDFAEEFE